MWAGRAAGQQVTQVRGRTGRGMMEGGQPALHREGSVPATVCENAKSRRLRRVCTLGSRGEGPVWIAVWV